MAHPDRPPDGPFTDVGSHIQPSVVFLPRLRAVAFVPAFLMAVTPFSAFASSQSPDPSTKHMEDSNSRKSKETDDFYYGPTQPIGHSLETPQAKQRISSLLAARIQTSVSDTSAIVSADLPPLVGGQYGFQEPTDFDGVPKALVNLGAPGPQYAIVVEKLHHRLSVFRSDRKNGDVSLIKTYRAITGKDPEAKVTRGDLRTPEGVYFVTGRLPDNALPPKYGRLAFTLDYPNVFDRLQKKSGYGIWIHATDDPRRLEKPFDTEGCVAVSNEDITEIESFIEPGVTPIIITKEMTSTYPVAMEPSRTSALKMVDSWREAWEQSEIDQYMGYYSDSFRQKNYTKNGWRSYKESIARARDSISIRLSEPTIVAFEDQLIVTFLQDYSSDGHSDFGVKALYLRWEENRYRIISEEWKPVQKTETALQDLLPPEGQL